jgi:hypothetical protein
MVEIKANLSVQIPGGPQINAAQIVPVEAYKYFDITLDPKKLTKDPKKLTKEVTLTEIQKLNLILVKSTATFAPGSKSKLEYKISDTGSFVELDAPLLFLGSWIRSIVATSEVKLVFQFTLDSAPTSSKDSVRVEILTGWPETI